MAKTVSEVQKRIVEKKARVYTAVEFKKLVREGRRPALEDVDIVTTGTFGVVSGTMAIFCIPVCGAGEFGHAERVTLNGVPANVGPCPNESLGMVDLTVNGTAKGSDSYGGGHLFRDMVAGNPIDVHVEADNGKTYDVRRTLAEIPFAKMITTRSFFKNYSCFATSGEDVATIFCGPRPMKGDWAEATVSGCGDINPVQNDPELRFLRQGAGIFINGAAGIVLGAGTRSSDSRPNLSVEADMHAMSPEYMGGFRTSVGPECTISVGTALPVLDQKTLDDLSVLNEETELGLGDVRDRIPVFRDTYASVWYNGNETVREDRSKCLRCTECKANANCPRDAHPASGIDRGTCMDCGLCVSTCVGGVFSCETGSVRFGDRDVPLVQRQSSRKIGLKVCEEIKNRVEEGKWSLGLFNGFV